MLFSLPTAGAVRVANACEHARETKTVGPTTNQIAHWCPDCGAAWTTWPDTDATAEGPVITVFGPPLRFDSVNFITFSGG
jgi:hypothetical protein